MAKSTKKYGCTWAVTDSPLQIELFCISKGGRWTNKKGEQCGEGLFEHKMKAFHLLWPKRYIHRWTELIMRETTNNRMTVLMGCASSQKTSGSIASFMIDYWASPEDTCLIISTTTIDKLEFAIFGEMKDLFKAARELHPWLAGNVIDHRHCIATDTLSKDDVRDLRKGVIARACQGKTSQGLGAYAGIKQVHVRFIADEIQFMPATFLNCLDNMFSNPDTKVCANGNPQHNPDDQLSLAGEPIDGWSSMPEPEKTIVWPTKFFHGRCVNLVGTDSPNFDYPDEGEHFMRLIGPRYVKEIADNPGGVDSPKYKTQAKGVMCMSLAKMRVITREQCRQHHAHDTVIWAGASRTKIYSVDPAYGGGDRCIGFYLEFGKSISGKTIIAIIAYREIPIRVMKFGCTDYKSPEEQIAIGVSEDLKKYGIDPNNCFYDSFGKGTVGHAFAQVFGRNSPIPVDSGGRPTKRIVRQGLFSYDGLVQSNRLKLCEEHYSKFVTEMWFSVSYAIDAEQLRGITDEIVAEGCARQYYTVKGDRFEVEDKAEMKKRLDGRSPDLFDCLCVGIEGARQRGFVIDQLGVDKNTEDDDEEDYFEAERRRYDEAISNSLLTQT